MYNRHRNITVWTRLFPCGHPVVSLIFSFITLGSHQITRQYVIGYFTVMNVTLGKRIQDHFDDSATIELTFDKYLTHKPAGICNK